MVTSFPNVKVTRKPEVQEIVALMGENITPCPKKELKIEYKTPLPNVSRSGNLI